MNANRPKNLNLTTISFPITAISSILHRITGILLFLLIPFSLHWLESSLASQAEFNALAECLNSVFAKIVIWGILSALFYHLFAGVRHIVMDLGFGESLEAGKRGSQLVILLAILVSIGIGVWLW